MNTCPHTPTCPPADAPDASAAKIIAEHLQECGYALLCNGRVLMEHGDLLPQMPLLPRSPVGAC